MFQETSFIPLEKLRKDVSDFVVPQMYYYIDNRALLPYLENNLIFTAKCIKHDFVNIDASQICRH